jgi:uncharacterized RmlC-like cupin family protein
MNNDCRLIKVGKTFQGKQGLTYYHGISKETVGAHGLCMHLLSIAEGVRAIAHLHRDHETALFMTRGQVDTWWGDDLENFVTVSTGEHFYIPANVPHLPWNRTNYTAVCVLSRTDPFEQESVVVLPDLDRRFRERHNVKLEL